MSPRDPLALDLDRGVLNFGQWYERKRTATKRVKPPKSDGKVDVPRYTPEELGAFLGIEMTPPAIAGRVGQLAGAMALPGLAGDLEAGLPPDLEDWFAAMDDADPVA